MYQTKMKVVESDQHTILQHNYIHYSGKTYYSIGSWGLYHKTYYEESVVDKFKSNLLLMIFWLNIINYNS